MFEDLGFFFKGELLGWDEGKKFSGRNGLMLRLVLGRVE